MRICLEELTIPEKCDKVTETPKDIEWIKVNDTIIEAYWWTNPSAPADWVGTEQERELQRNSDA